MTSEDCAKLLTTGSRGSFAQLLGEAWYRGDSGNRAKIEKTWPDFFFSPLSREGLLKLLADAQTMMGTDDVDPAEFRRVNDAINRELKGAE